MASIRQEGPIAAPCDSVVNFIPSATYVLVAGRGFARHRGVSRGVPAEYIEIDSPHGHDSFLIDLDQVGPPLRHFLANV